MVSKILRRSHMYLALFLTPWMVMYTASTLVMNHREQFRTGPPEFELEREAAVDVAASDPANSRQVARSVLLSLGLDGAFHVNRPAKDGALTIQRLDPVTPRRIVYRPAEKKAVIERQVFEANAFLERMHRRRGFQQDYVLDDAWAFTVDLVIAAMLFWVFSGLWMWWEMKPSRRLGAILGVAGAVLFTCLLVTI